uniref:Bm1626 n=1 Tax=Brugia malayi TaxID=6279 RepID=A0A1I9G620_BRUMA|nr:Bm1626 [Brugia malayi]
MKHSQENPSTKRATNSQFDRQSRSLVDNVHLPPAQRLVKCEQSVQLSAVLFRCGDRIIMFYLISYVRHV